MDQLLKILLARDKDLERKRTTALARGWWHKVIDIEARIDENKLIRQQIVAQSTYDTAKSASPPTS